MDLSILYYEAQHILVCLQVFRIVGKTWGKVFGASDGAVYHWIRQKTTTMEGKEIETSNCSIQDLSPHQLTGIFDYHLWHV